MEKPNNYLVKSILFTYFFCFPFGIAAIVNAAKVNRLWNAGQYNESREASEKANHWCKMALIFGILFYALIVLFYIIYFVFILSMAF